MYIELKRTPLVFPQLSSIGQSIALTLPKLCVMVPTICSRTKI